MSLSPLSTESLLDASRADFGRGAHEEGERRARTALAQASADGDAVAQRDALELVSKHADRRGLFVVAAGAAEQALALMPDEPRADRARMHCHLARLYATLDLDAGNLRHATAAFEIARSGTDVALLCLTLSRLGAARAAARDWRAGVALIEEALQLAAGDPVETFRALNNLAAASQYAVFAARRRGDRAAALEAARAGLRWADQAVARAGDVRDSFCEMIALMNRGSLLVELERVVEARRDCDAARAIGQRDRHVSLALELEHMDGKLAVLEGDVAGGLARLEAMVARVESGDLSLLARHHEDLYLLYKRVGDATRALEHHETLLALERGRAERRADAEYQILLERDEVQRVARDADHARREAERERDRASRLQSERDLLEARAEEMGRHAFEDVLTGLPNRRRVEERMATVLARAGGAHGAVSVGVIDLDHFKEINDRYGHGTGDDVLRTVGAILAHGLRDTDLVGRVGGEEFVLLLDRTPVDVAVATCERLRRAVEDYDWSTIRAGLALTTSIGLWTADAPVDVRVAIERADTALYAAKAAGRNRVVVERS